MNQTRNQNEAGSKKSFVSFSLGLVFNREIEATFPSETSVDFQRPTQCYILEDSILYFVIC
jgi:hypothetical protein